MDWPEDNYLPFLQFFTPVYKDREKIYLLMDGTHAGKNKTLMVSFLYKDKVIPLVWLSESGIKGNFKEDKPIKPMAKALRALEGLTIICTKDKLLGYLLGSKKLNYSLIQIGFLALERLEIQNQHFNDTS